MSKIIQLTVENVKRLKAVKITPDGSLVIIGGENGQGKTSILDSITMAIGGANEIPSMPVRKGQEKAKVTLELDDLVIKRTFTEAGGTQLIVENKEGARYNSPQAILDKLTGKLTFDPLAFIRMKPDAQATALKNLVGLDLSALEAQRRKLYDERTLVNKDVDRAKVQSDALPHFPDAPAAEVNPADIFAEIEKANAHNQANAEQLRLLNEKADELGDAQLLQSETEKLITDLEKELADARKALATRKADAEKLAAIVLVQKQICDALKNQDATPLREKLSQVQAVNKQIQANAARSDALSVLKTKREKSAALTKQIEAIDTEKDAKLSATKFPIEGLSFADTGVVFGGIPFEQASAAEQMKVSVAIAAAMNPKLKVMLIRDGSLLDKKSLALLGELAEAHGLQIWIERVGNDSACSVIIEDGEVLARN